MVDLLDMVECLDGRTITLTNTVVDMLKSRMVVLKQVMEFCADTCNAMFGANTSVAVHLEKRNPRSFNSEVVLS